MHILFLTDNFPPEGNAPASRTFEHAREWVRLGHKVTVITGAPNFPEGKVYPGFKNVWYEKGDMEGINVVRVKTYIAENAGFSKRILDYMSFMLTSFIGGLFVKKVDVVVATSPQFFTAISGWLLSVFKRRAFVFELRDIWPASITAVGAMEKSWLISLLEKIEIFLYRKAKLIVSVTESFRYELIERGICGNKICVIRNGVDLSQFAPHSEQQVLKSKYGLNNKLVVGYIGTHGMAHGLSNIVEAAKILRNYENIAFLFAGGGAEVEKVYKLVEKYDLKNVLVLGRQDKQKMPEIWALCDVSLIHLKNSPLFESVIPSKIFESMGMGLPMIMALPKGEASQIVLDCGAGLHVNPEDPAALSETIVQVISDSNLMNSLSNNALMNAKKFERSAQARAMLDKLLELKSV